MSTIQNIIRDFEAIGYTVSYSNRLFNHVMKKGDNLIMFKFIDDTLYYVMFDHEFNVAVHGLELYFKGPDYSYDEHKFGSEFEDEFEIIERYDMCHLGNHITRGEL